MSSLSDGVFTVVYVVNVVVVVVSVSELLGQRSTTPCARTEVAKANRKRTAFMLMFVYRVRYVDDG